MTNDEILKEMRRLGELANTNIAPSLWSTPKDEDNQKEQSGCSPKQQPLHAAISQRIDASHNHIKAELRTIENLKALSNIAHLFPEELREALSQVVPFL